MALDPRLIRNAVAEDPARGVGGVAPTYEVRGVWVAGRRGRSAPDADRIPVPHRRSGLRPRRLLIRRLIRNAVRSEEHTSELQSLMRNSYAVFCLNKKTHN